MSTKLKFVLIPFFIFPAIAYPSDFLTPGLWINASSKVCVAKNNIIPSLRYLKLEVEISFTGSEQSAFCNNGIFIFKNQTGYEAKFTCVERTGMTPPPQSGRKYVQSKPFVEYIVGKKVGSNRFYGTIQGKKYIKINNKSVNYYLYSGKNCMPPINTWYNFSIFNGFPVSPIQEKVTLKCQGGVTSKFCCKNDTVNFPNHGKKSPNLCGAN